METMEKSLTAEKSEEQAWLSRVYVETKVVFDPGGLIFPLEILWPDGRVFPIDEICDVRETELAYTGRRRDRYTVKIRGQRCCLYFERSGLPRGHQVGRWYVEKK